MSTEVRSVLGDPKLCSQLSDVKNSFTSRDSIFETIILSTNNPMLSSKLNVLSHNSLPSCQIWKIPSQAGVVVLQKLFWVSTILCYLQNWTFHIIFLFISIVFALSLHKPHFLLFKCNFDSLEWKFGTYYFM